VLQVATRVPPAPKRSQTPTWKIRRHIDCCPERTSTGRSPHLRPTGGVEGAVSLHLESRGVTIAGITAHPDQNWMQQTPGTLDRWAICIPAFTSGTIAKRSSSLCSRNVPLCPIAGELCCPDRRPPGQSSATWERHSSETECGRRLVPRGDSFRHVDNRFNVEESLGGLLTYDSPRVA
jgi:hypothetical protein